MAAKDCCQIAILLSSKVVVQETSGTQRGWVGSVNWVADEHCSECHTGWGDAIGLDT